MGNKKPEECGEKHKDKNNLKYYQHNTVTAFFFIFLDENAFQTDI